MTAGPTGRVTGWAECHHPICVQSFRTIERLSRRRNSPRIAL